MGRSGRFRLRRSRTDVASPATAPTPASLPDSRSPEPLPAVGVLACSIPLWNWSPHVEQVRGSDRGRDSRRGVALSTIAGPCKTKMTLAVPAFTPYFNPGVAVGVYRVPVDGVQLTTLGTGPSHIHELEFRYGACKRSVRSAPPTMSQSGEVGNHPTVVRSWHRDDPQVGNLDPLSEDVVDP